MFLKKNIMSDTYRSAVEIQIGPDRHVKLQSTVIEMDVLIEKATKICNKLQFDKWDLQ